jgi:hypothetical protein
MRKWLIWVLLCCLLLGGCVKETYRESDFLGKSGPQIVSEFGEFDCGGHPDEDGLYRNTSCGYTIKEPRVSFLGTDPEVLFFIVFDNNGIAVRCYEGYRPGG